MFRVWQLRVQLRLKASKQFSCRISSTLGSFLAETSKPLVVWKHDHEVPHIRPGPLCPPRTTTWHPCARASSLRKLWLKSGVRCHVGIPMCKRSPKHHSFPGLDLVVRGQGVSLRRRSSGIGSLCFEHVAGRAWPTDDIDIAERVARGIPMPIESAFGVPKLPGHRGSRLTDLHIANTLAQCYRRC